jgi:hypothetical protein
MRCSWRCVFITIPCQIKFCAHSEIALECGLATKSLSGEVSITRAIRALESLEKDFEFVACSSDCYSTAEIFFTPKLFEFLGVFPLSLSEARLKCLAAKNSGRESADE